MQRIWWFRGSVLLLFGALEERFLRSVGVSLIVAGKVAVWTLEMSGCLGAQGG